MLPATKTKASEKSEAFFVFTFFLILFVGTDYKSALSLSQFASELGGQIILENGGQIDWFSI